MDEFFWGETLEATVPTVFDMTADFAIRATPPWPDIDQPQNLRAVWSDDARGRKISIMASFGKDAAEVPLVDVRVGTAGNTASHIEIYTRYGDVKLAEMLRDYYLHCLGSAKQAASGAAPSVTIEHADKVEVFAPGSQKVEQKGGVNIVSGKDSTIGQDVVGGNKSQNTQ